MSRRMSVSMTLDAVRDRTKTVTRRHVDSWKHLQAGDRLTLIEKGMGLPKGAKQVVVCEVEIVDVRVEPLRLVTDDEVKREGLWPAAQRALAPIPEPHRPGAAEWFVQFWLQGHGFRGTVAESVTVECRRIEWRYLEECP